MDTHSELDLICKAMQMSRAHVTQLALAIGVPLLRQQILSTLSPVSKVRKKAVLERRCPVPQGRRPTLLKALVYVMGDKELSCPEIQERLRKKGWASTRRSSTYISALLANHPETFGRVRRGVYRVLKQKRVSPA